MTHIGNLFSGAQFTSCFSFPISLPRWPSGCFLGLLPRQMTYTRILFSACPSGDPNEGNMWGRRGQFKLDFAPPHFPTENFEKGVPYRITVTAVSPGGLYPAPSVWTFREELGKQWGWKMEGPGTLANLDPLALSPAPLVGPALWRLQDAPPGTPAIAWGEVPRHQLRGHLTHYTLCAQSGTRPSVCMNGELSCLLPLLADPTRPTHQFTSPLVLRWAPVVLSQSLGEHMMSSVP